MAVRRQELQRRIQGQGERNRTTTKKVNQILLQARQWVQMWHSHRGDSATPAAIIEALEECGGGEEIILNIKKICS